MLVRQARNKDYDQLIGLLHQLNPVDPEATEVEFEVFQKIMDAEHLHLIVAEHDGILLGSCYLNVILNITRGGKPYAVIENVITDSEHRNRGIGALLINRVIEIAWHQNCYKVMLMSGRTEKEVHAFYKKCGFNAEEKQAFVQRAPNKRMQSDTAEPRR